MEIRDNHGIKKMNNCHKNNVFVQFIQLDYILPMVTQYIMVIVL